MIVIPAVDLRDGRCVRLFQGDFARETVYADDPVAMARHWANRGATWLHVVDLDGARAGAPVQLALVRAIVQATPEVSVQAGGGVRSLAAIRELLEAGVARVVVGTVALEQPELVAEALERFGADRIVVAVDSRDGLVATRGWESTAAIEAEAVVRRLAESGVRRILATDIARDGTLTGPNIELMARLAGIGVTVIASGGVRGPEDLVALARVPGVEATVVGRALYEGRLRLERPSDWVIAGGAG
ncbi:MAG: 1-(5-phosphoribosyl)-5-[(5-phosphoribosylamino)methylideneamino]imidazole-4-carboxamide isomerase [Thermomicrobium sp.]|nr:1-(5-phosphoribosyl)-5-[(5-phosphoribosylamino)methylideneamino]imidazole-4-carboxamide isomerase [Thermomicrobium sp.]